MAFFVFFLPQAVSLTDVLCVHVILKSKNDIYFFLKKWRACIFKKYFYTLTKHGCSHVQAIFLSVNACTF